MAGGVQQGSGGLKGKGQDHQRTAEHDGQRSDIHGQGQVAQAARWLATLKASGRLCLLDGRETTWTFFAFAMTKTMPGKVREKAWQTSAESLKINPCNRDFRNGENVSFRRFTLGLCFGNQLGKWDFQRLGKGIGPVQTWIAQAALNHANVGLMQPGLLCKGLLAQIFCFPMPLQHHSKGIRKFQTAAAH
jgi:hypothetical protein